MPGGEIKGVISQFQSLGTLDGPGLRYIIFMQGCQLRCIYCHNPETWTFEGRSYTVDEVLEKILRCGSYIKKGGVTVSGGEPLLQWRFVKNLFSGLQREGIHTALDTSGAGDLQGAEEVLKATDLVICDLKFSTAEEYRKYTGGNMDHILRFLKLTEQCGVPLWIRHVVVPGITDNVENVERIHALAHQYNNLEKFELLPFRKLCAAKYETMGIPFPLADTEECTSRTIECFEKLLKRSDENAAGFDQGSGKQKILTTTMKNVII